MSGITLQELRDLSRRSRRAQAWGFVAMLGTLACFPALSIVWTFWPAWSVWAAYGATVVAGLFFLAFAYRQGEARGAFRRVFRRIKADSRRRVLVPTGPEPAQKVESQRS